MPITGTSFLSGGGDFAHSVYMATCEEANWCLIKSRSCAFADVDYLAETDRASGEHDDV